jgi:tetratricopeptide (TPR) repeat protein
MAEPKLDDVLKAWAAAERERDPGKDCPAISLMWLHVTEGQPLGEHANHVAGCARCQRRLDVIRHELWQTERRPVGTGARVILARVPESMRFVAGAFARRRVRLGVIGTTAVAASIVLAVLLLPRTPAFAKDYLSIGLYREAEQRYAKSLEAAEQAVRENPDSRRAWLLKARALFRLGRTNEAKAIVEPILAEDPGDALANLHMAALVRAANPRRATEYERKADARMPDDAEAWYLRGWLAGALENERVRLALQLRYYSRALELDPNHARARNLRAWNCYERRDYAAMRADGEVVVSLCPDWFKAWDTLAVARDRTGQYEAAVEAFNRCLELVPDNAGSYNNRALTLIHAKRFEQALEDCRRALDLDPGYWASAWHAGWAHRFLGNREQALERFQSVITFCDLGDPYENEYRVCAAAQVYVLLTELNRASEAEQFVAGIAGVGALAEWPWALAGFYARHVSAEQVVQAAGADPEKRCRAYLYIGEFQYVHGKHEAAGKSLEKCLEVGVEWFVEYEYAVSRLEEVTRPAP